MTDTGTLVVRNEIDDGIVRLTLNRPSSLNALTDELIEELHARISELETDRSCRVVILTGAGRGFCAGADLHAQRPEEGDPQVGGPALRLQIQSRYSNLVPRMRRLRQPVVAAVNGPAAGGGFSLALAADIRIAAQSAKFNAAFIRVGFSGTDMGCGWLLPRLIGASRAFELLLTGRLIGADEAERIGLVCRVVPDGEVMDAALATARLIRANSPFGVWITKAVMWSNLEVSMQAGIDLEDRNQSIAGFSEDRDEAKRAFLERREPIYRYR